MKLKAKDFVWDKKNREHIAKHGLRPRQVEQILQDDNLIIQHTYADRLLITGQSGKRMVTAVIVPEGKKYYVVTARDASKKERAYYRENY